MKKPFIIALVAALVVVVLGYFVFAASDDEEVPSNTSDTSQTQPTEDEQTAPVEEDDTEVEPMTSAVTIDNRSFVQDSITVKAGTKVTWTNQDSMDHDVTPDEETTEFKRSDMLSNGDSYSVTFTTPGTYTYHCTPHPDMTGTVTVTE